MLVIKRKVLNENMISKNRQKPINFKSIYPFDIKYMEPRNLWFHKYIAKIWRNEPIILNSDSLNTIMLLL